MEILVTIAYYFLVRLIFIDYKLLRFTLVWKFVVFGLYAAAALTEIVLLGQYGPYSKQMVVEAYVIPMAPEFGGIVQAVHAKPNQLIEAGDPLFEMDASQWQQRKQERAAAHHRAKDEYGRLTRARTAVSQEEIVAARDQLTEAEARLEEAQYNLDHTAIVAPTDGYAVNVQLRPGAFIRIKQPVMTFVSTDEYYLVATVNQKAARWVDPGDEAEVAFNLYPGKVFPAVVDSVIWARGRAQLLPSGQLPEAMPILETLESSNYFAVRLRLADEDPAYPLRYGAIGLAAIYTGEGPDVFKLLRQLEIRSESWLNYLYNPF